LLCFAKEEIAVQNNTLSRVGLLACVLLAGCGGGGGGGDGATPPGPTPPAPVAGARPLDRATHVSVSSDGRFVAYVGVPGASAGLPPNASQFQNVFVHDVAAGTRAIVSVDPAGTNAGNAISQAARLGPGGSFVVFTSRATNLVPGPVYPGGVNQIFARDLATGSTRLLSLNPAGTSAGNGDVSDRFAISGNGRFVAFASAATNLVAGITYAPGANVFVRDLVADTTEIVSVAADGVTAGCCGTFNDSHFPAISDDGRYVAFGSYATNLVAGPFYPSNVAGIGNVFLRDRQAATTQLVSLSPTGTNAADGHCSVQTFSDGTYLAADGSVLAFACRARNLVIGPAYPNNPLGAQDDNIFAWSRATTTVSLLSHAPGGASAANDGSFTPVVSADGRYVAFQSRATNLIPGVAYFLMLNGRIAANVFRHDRQAGSTQLLSLGPDMVSAADFDTQFPQISADGLTVAFGSTATNLSATQVALTFDDRQDNAAYWRAGAVSIASQGPQLQPMGRIQPVVALSGGGTLLAFISNLDGVAYYRVLP
jgi:Tol biopolymer transport system component